MKLFQIGDRYYVLVKSNPNHDQKTGRFARSPSEASEHGAFGPILTGFRHDAQGAIKALMALRDGEAVAALHHPEVGDIDLVWGAEGTAASDGYGLAKLIKYHPEVLKDLQGILSRMKVNKAKSGHNRTRLESSDHEASARLTWNGQAKKWLLTAYKKKDGSATDTRTDTTGLGGAGDTARRTNASKSIVLPASNGSKLLEKSIPLLFFSQERP